MHVRTGICGLNGCGSWPWRPLNCAAARGSGLRAERDGEVDVMIISMHAAPVQMIMKTSTILQVADRAVLSSCYVSPISATRRFRLAEGTCNFRIRLGQPRARAMSSSAAITSVANIQECLTGSWIFERFINDRKNNCVIEVEGTANWAESSPDRLLYTELGRLKRNDLSLAAAVETRNSYEYRLNAGHPAACDVYFSDGRFFHELDLSTGKHESIVHNCVNDVYTGTWLALVVANSTPAVGELPSSTRRLRVTWTVAGPTKDYTSITDYSRARIGDAAASGGDQR